MNLKSCADLGLVVDDILAKEDTTILWLMKNIRETYSKSLTLDTSSPLPDVLGQFHSWIGQISNTIPDPYPNVVVWGKPSFYDNV